MEKDDVGEEKRPRVPIIAEKFASKKNGLVCRVQVVIPLPSFLFAGNRENGSKNGAYMFVAILHITTDSALGAI